ncbi:MAG: exosortase-associated EpsI family protein [Armatimonadota bacterium]
MQPHAKRHLVAIVVLVVGIVLSVAARRARPREAGYSVDFSNVPLQVAGMEGRELPEVAEVARFLEADAMRTIVYGQGAEQVTVNLIYGATWRTVHTPAQCYPATGWRIIWEDEIIIPVEEAVLPHRPPMAGKLMRVERDRAVQLVLFVFAHKGGTSVNYTEHCWAVASGPPGAGGLSILLSTPLTDEEVEAAKGRLLSVAAGVYPHAVQFWYEDR